MTPNSNSPELYLSTIVTVKVLPEQSGNLNWPSAIGLFIINFGTLEYSVLCFLKDRLSADGYEKARKRHLHDRLELIRTHLTQSAYPANLLNDFDSFCGRIAPLRDLRNHIAHGYFYVRINDDTSEIALSVMQAIDADNGLEPVTRHVSLQELWSALGSLGQLMQEFHRISDFQPMNLELEGHPDIDIQGNAALRDALKGDIAERGSAGQTPEVRSPVQTRHSPAIECAEPGFVGQ